MMEIHSQRAYPSDRTFLRTRSRTPRKTQTMPISADLLDEILMSFLDLDLTPQEMSRTSGLPLSLIMFGLANRN